jgi:hypothetical protein
VDPDLAGTILDAFEHRHEIVHLLYTAIDETDAVHRIANLLKIDDQLVTPILNTPLRWMLPQYRERLYTTGERTSPTDD